MRLNQCHANIDVHILSYRSSVDAWILDHLEEFNDIRPTNDQLHRIYQFVQQQVAGTNVHRFLGSREIFHGVIDALYKVTGKVENKKKEIGIVDEEFQNLVTEIKQKQDVEVSRMFITMMFPGHLPVFMMHIQSGYIRYQHGALQIYGLEIDTLTHETMDQWTRLNWNRLSR